MTERLQINDRVTDMIGRDGTVIEIDDTAPLRQVKVQFDMSDAETVPEGMLEKRPGWGSGGRNVA